MRRDPVFAPLHPRAAAAHDAGAVEFAAVSGSYLLAAGEVTYRLPVPGSPERPGLLIEGRLGEGAWQSLLTGPRMLPAPTADGEEAAAASTMATWSHKLRGKTVTFLAEEKLQGGRRIELSIQARLIGRTLELTVKCPGGPRETAYAGFAVGSPGPVLPQDGCVRREVCGMPDPLCWWQPQGGGPVHFLSAYLDPWLGRAASHAAGSAVYLPLLDGNVPTIEEHLYVTLSADPLDPLPVPNRMAGPARSMISGRMTLDYFSHQPFETDAEFLRTLEHYGLHEVLLIYRNWQQFGYRQRETQLHPPNPERGGVAGFRRMTGAAREMGWLCAPRQEYASLTPSDRFLSGDTLALHPTGEPRLARRPGSCAVAADRMVELARLEASTIERNFRPGAVFVDAHTAFAPGGHHRQVCASGRQGADTAAAALSQVGALLDYLRCEHAGPVVGASGAGRYRMDTLAAGMADGLLRGPGDAANQLFPDYEFAEIRQRSVPIGAGSYGGESAVEPADVDWDRYRARELALGHAAYAGNYGLRRTTRETAFPGGSPRNLLREYYLVRPLQEIYLEASVRSIRYSVNPGDEEGMDLAACLARGLDPLETLVSIEFTGGLRVWVNLLREEIRSVEWNGEPHRLPPTGYLAAHDRRRLCVGSLLLDDSRRDFARGLPHRLVDSRDGGPTTIDGLRTDGMAVVLRSQVPARHDLLLSEGTFVEWDKSGETEGEAHGHRPEGMRSSLPSDLRLRYAGPREVELAVIRTQGSRPAHVTLALHGPVWETGALLVEELAGERWTPSRCQVNLTTGGPQLNRVSPGRNYRLTAGSSG